MRATTTHPGLRHDRVGFAHPAAGSGFGVPTLREDLVRRPALVSRLAAAPDASLALVVAPAGYGKSTLLAEWAACDERPFVWISLTAGDCDADGVAARIVHALQDTEWVDSGAPAIRRARTANLVVLERLMRFLERAGRRLVLVIDDAHQVPPAAMRTVGSLLLDAPATGAQIVVASRSEPPLPIGRLRANRRLVEVGRRELAMSPAEAAALLRMAGVDLDFGGVQTLSGVTEGWPVGLYLAARSLRADNDRPARLSEFGGDDRPVADYLRDEVLAGLSPKLRRFMVRTSVLKELSGPLCDAVLDQTGSGATLSRLERGQAMVIALDRREQRFRCHRLLRTMLSAELARTEPELQSELHGRASRWLRRNGDQEGAIVHAAAAGDVSWTGQLLAERLPHYMARGQSEIVENWIDAFAPTEVAGSNALSLVAAMTSLVSGKGDRARRWASLSTGPAENAGSVACGTHILKALAGHGGPVAMAANASAAYEGEPAHSPWRPFSCLLWGVAEQLAGGADGARLRLQEGADVATHEAPAVAALCLAQLALLAIDEDEWESATELTDRAMEMVRRRGLERYPLCSVVFAAAAATRAQQGRVDEAKRDLRRATDLLAALGDAIPWYAAEARLALAHAAIGLADTVGARALLAQASRLARRTPEAVMFQRWLDRAWAQIDTLAESALSGPSSLTIAELRILRFLPSHRSFREIAERLDVSVNTVKTQAHAVYRKLDVGSRSEAVARAAQAGLLGC